MWQIGENFHKLPLPHPLTSLFLCPHSLPSLVTKNKVQVLLSKCGPMHLCLDLISRFLHYQCFLYGSLTSSFSVQQNSSEKLSSCYITSFRLCFLDPTLYMIYRLIQATKTALLKVSSGLSSPNPMVSSPSSP